MKKYKISKLIQNGFSLVLNCQIANRQIVSSSMTYRDSGLFQHISFVLCKRMYFEMLCLRTRIPRFRTYCKLYFKEYIQYPNTIVCVLSFFFVFFFFVFVFFFLFFFFFCSKGGNLFHFLFAFPINQTVPNRDQLLKERIASKGENSFLLLFKVNRETMIKN